MVSNMKEKLCLTSEQQEAISEINRNLQIIACAGSGKTEVITRRIVNILKSKPDILPENIVAFTFTEKAAKAMRERIASALGEGFSDCADKMYIGTIHGFCYNLLIKYTKRFQSYKILDTVKSHLFIDRYYNCCGMSDLVLNMSDLNLKLCPVNIKLYLQCIEKMLDDYDNMESWTQNQRDVLKKYINCLYDHGYIDFTLMIFEALKQIEDNTAVKKYLTTIKYLVVDEYQDVNDLQEKLISHIAEAGANICVVGDDDQTIYQFRGSNANNMITFAERYKNVHQVRLEKNFRCATAIVDVADCVISHNARRLPKKMVSGVSKINANVEAIRYQDKNEQYASIADRIIRLNKSGVPYYDMAILVRKSKVIVPMTEALQREGIPFEADSAEHFFEGDYFRRFATTLEILKDIDKAKLYEYWQDITGADDFNIGYKFLRSCSRNGNMRLSKIIDGFCEKIVFISGGVKGSEIRQADLNSFKEILDDVDEIYGDWQLSARITKVINFLSTQAAEEYKYHSFGTDNISDDAVQVMTVHKAKGLEFNTVFLPELTTREFPVSNIGGKKYWQVLGGTFEENKDKYQSSLDDERKLFYVAVTRAKQNLYMTYELSSQPLSCFVIEAAESHYLKINRNDLTFDPKSGKADYPSDAVSCDTEYAEEEPEQMQEYWDLVKYAKEQLHDYFGTGAHFNPAMYDLLGEINHWDPDKILREASENALI